MAKRVAISTRTRWEILERDDFTCQYCGQYAPNVELQIEHVEPVSRGGTNDMGNLLTACRQCNAGKSDLERNDEAVKLDEIVDAIGRHWCNHYVIEKGHWRFINPRSAIIRRLYLLMRRGEMREAMYRAFREHPVVEAGREPHGAWGKFLALCWTRIEQTRWE